MASCCVFYQGNLLDKNYTRVNVCYLICGSLNPRNDEFVNIKDSLLDSMSSVFPWNNRVRMLFSEVENDSFVEVLVVVISLGSSLIDKPCDENHK